MNISDLKSVLAIARYGSINKAAKELYIAQPNLSKSIQNLEKEYGIQIFERSSRGGAAYDGRTGICGAGTENYWGN